MIIGNVIRDFLYEENIIPASVDVVHSTTIPYSAMFVFLLTQLNF